MSICPELLSLTGPVMRVKALLGSWTDYAVHCLGRAVSTESLVAEYSPHNTGTCTER